VPAHRPSAESDLTLIGLVAMADPARVGVPEAVKDAHHRVRNTVTRSIRKRPVRESQG
jgi:magnesium-transporting ATPase (P-type)